MSLYLTYEDLPNEVHEIIMRNIDRISCALFSLTSTRFYEMFDFRHYHPPLTGPGLATACAKSNNISILKWAIQSVYPYDESTMAAAAEQGNLEVPLVEKAFSFLPLASSHYR